MRLLIKPVDLSANDASFYFLEIHAFAFVCCRFEMLKTADGSINGSLKVVESIKNNKKNKKKSKDNTSDWTWKEQVNLNLLIVLSEKDCLISKSRAIIICDAAEQCVWFHRAACLISADELRKKCRRASNLVLVEILLNARPISGLISINHIFIFFVGRVRYCYETPPACENKIFCSVKWVALTGVSRNILYWANPGGR